MNNLLPFIVIVLVIAAVIAGTFVKGWNERRLAAQMHRQNLQRKAQKHTHKLEKSNHKSLLRDSRKKIT